jgi:transposase
MANKSISMSKLRQVIRLKSQGLSNRRVSLFTGLHRETIRSYENQIKSSGMDYAFLLEQSDQDLEAYFVRERIVVRQDSRVEELSAYFPEMEKELGRVGMDKHNCWKEYKERYPEGYAYSHFCREYNRWQRNRSVSARFEHKAGEKMYVDYTGSKLSIVDRSSGEIKTVEVLVVVLGYSQYTYVEAMMSQKKEEFIAGVENALHYYGGVPQGIVTDNLRSAVSQSCNYEPKVNETFERFALHYNTVILPTRSRKPKDKALVEGAVNIVYKRIFAPLRNRVFHSLSELNTAIREQLHTHNTKLFKGREHSRRDLFEGLEKSTLSPLSGERYELQISNWLSVHKNSHIYLHEDKHYYSVPYRLIGQKVKVVYSRSCVEVYYHYERVAAHKRVYGQFSYTTLPDHLPSTHRFVSEWNPERFIRWASEIGEPTRLIIEGILQTKSHPEQSYKACLGVLGFVRKVGKDRLNNACARALYYQSYGYNVIKNILAKGLDKQPAQLDILSQIPEHENIRGGYYYN